jgi:hypothetical protein
MPAVLVFESKNPPWWSGAFGAAHVRFQNSGRVLTTKETEARNSEVSTCCPSPVNVRFTSAPKIP